MKKNAWTLVYWISLSVMGILGVIWAANSIASENGSAFLPDTVRVILGITDLICLFIFVFSRIKGKDNRG